MTNSAKERLKPDLTPNEQKVRQLFADYVKAARAIFATENNDPHYTNSEVSIITHTVLHEFDAYRSMLK